jgi:hypothetical protein
MDALNQEKLRQISLQLRDRTRVFLVSSDLFTLDDSSVVLKKEKSGELAIDGGIVIVESANESELLPLEAFTGYRVPRKPGEHVAEIGRFTVRKGAKELTPKLILAAAVSLFREGKVSRIFIEADEAHAKIFGKYGFTEVTQRTNYAADLEFVMEVTPEKLLTESITKDFGALND